MPLVGGLMFADLGLGVAQIVRPNYSYVQKVTIDQPRPIRMVNSTQFAVSRYAWNFEVRNVSDLSLVNTYSVTGGIPALASLQTMMGMDCDGTYLYTINYAWPFAVKWRISDWTVQGYYGSGAYYDSPPYYAFNQTNAIATDGEFVWVADGGSNSHLSKLRCDTMARVSYHVEAQYSALYSICYSPGDDTLILGFGGGSQGHGIRKINKTTRAVLIDLVGPQGSGNDQFSVLQGMHCDGTYLYVVDAYNSRIHVRNASDLSFVRMITTADVTPAVINSNSRGITITDLLIQLDPPIASASPRRLSNLISFTSVAGAASYNIYWSYTPGVSTANTKIAGVTSPYSHSGLLAGLTVYYIVTTVSPIYDVESLPSNEVSATPLSLESSDGRVIW